MNPDDREPVELLAEEYLERYRRGENPTLSEYVERHPQWAAEIEEVIPAMMLVEECKPGGAFATSPLPDAGLAPGDRLGDYEILQEVGRGGMGIVYRAEQVSLKRQVALKVLPAAALLSGDKLERFRREAQAAARLHHTHIVQVFGVGEDAGLHYYVMQYVEGASLDAVLAAGGDLPGPERAARIAAEAAHALHYAHEQGTLHRDVKPANMLIDARGRAWLTDFGLAKALSEADELTQAGDVIGTVRYMPPERFEGVSDERGDVYGLGLTLHELLTGRPVFDGLSDASLMRAVREDGPTPPSRLNSSVPRDLETIALRATARDPGNRYASAAALAEDLERFLEDRPILARRASSIERAWRWCRRNRLMATLAATAALSLLIAAAAGWLGYAMTTAALEREAQRGDEAEAATRLAESNVQLSLDAFEEIFDSMGISDRPPRRRNSPRASRSRPEGTESDAALLQSMLDFYDRFSARNATNPRLQHEAGKAYRRVGVIRERLGQRVAAVEAFSRSARGLKDLVSAFPEDPAYRLELAETYSASCARAGETPDLTAAESRCRRGIELCNRVALERSEESRVFDLLVTLHCRLAAILAHADRLDDAAAALEAADRIRRERHERFGSEPPSFRVDLAKARQATADRMLDAGHSAEARALLEAAIEDFQEDSTRRRPDPQNPNLLSGLHRRHARALSALGEHDAAREAQRQADASRRPQERRPERNRGRRSP